MNDELRSDVLRRKYGGQSGRDIARELHLSRKTVAKVLAEHRQQRAQGATGVPPPRQGRGSMVDAYESTLRDFLSRYPDMTVVRLLEECRVRGYAGGYTVLRQRIKQLRNPIPAGSTGTVTSVRNYGAGREPWFQVDVAWDNGRKLMLVVPPNQFALLPRDAKE
ncbi:hypothetical protein EG831_08485 [bacterium]|nr:hypothetical protein [bacterium]